MDLQEIRQKWQKGLWEMTGHARKRMGQRRITAEEIGEVILQGEILEDYPEDKPYPSCLIMGRIRQGWPLYVVCALGQKVSIVTAHWMDPSKWLDPETRRERRK